MSTTQKGFLWVIAACSGTGKSTVCQKLLKEWSHARLSISYTTRAPREGEEDGIHYHFISKEEFLEMRSQNQFLESAQVHDQYYGTGRAKTEELLAAGQDVLLDIDVQGAQSIREVFGPQAIQIFLLPPSWEVMVKRLVDRGTETQERIQRRLRTAREEMPLAKEFDYMIVNDQLDDTVKAIQAIRDAESKRTLRNQELLDTILQQIPQEDPPA